MTSEKEYLILCDESDRKGKFFSNFYGGLRVGASHLESVNSRLLSKKRELGLNSEVKWSKTDQLVVERYEQLIKAFFDEVDAGHVVGRIMFTQNARVAKGLTDRHHEQEYYILYYQFIKHAFGLRHIPLHISPPKLRIYLDEIGDTKEQMAKFRGYISGLAMDSRVRKSGLVLKEEDITEVRSHDHILMQCLDVVLGSIPFRLNDKHKEKLPGQGFRGKRTMAKERLYNFIYKEICRVSGRRFNIGCSTSVSPFPDGRWSMKYRHWLFKPSESEFDGDKAKG